MGARMVVCIFGFGPVLLAAIAMIVALILDARDGL